MNISGKELLATLKREHPNVEYVLNTSETAIGAWSDKEQRFCTIAMQNGINFWVEVGDLFINGKPCEMGWPERLDDLNGMPNWMREQWLKVKSGEKVATGIQAQDEFLEWFKNKDGFDSTLYFDSVTSKNPWQIGTKDIWLWSLILPKKEQNA